MHISRKSFDQCVMICFNILLFVSSGIAFSQTDPRIEKLTFEVVKWNKTLQTNSIDCQYRFEYKCHRDACKERDDMEEYYEELVYFRYQHPNQYVRRVRIQPTEGNYTHQESAIYNNKVAKRFDYSNEYRGGFVNSPEIADAETFGLNLLPTGFFENPETKYPRVEEFVSKGSAFLYEWEEFVVLSFQMEHDSKSLDYYFDGENRVRRLDLTSRPPLGYDELYPPRPLLQETWGDNELLMCSLIFSMFFDEYVEVDYIHFPLSVKMQYWDFAELAQAGEVRKRLFAAKANNDDLGKAHALCDFYRLPRKVDWEYDVRVEQITLNSPLSEDDFRVEFPPGAYVNDWSVGPRMFGEPVIEEPETVMGEFKITPYTLSSAAAVLSVVFGSFAFLFWFRRRSVATK